MHIEPNEFVFLVGKSGAGKSTLMKMITKEERPDSGKIIIGGLDLDYVKKRHIPGYRRRLGIVFQDFKLLPRRTVYENVAFALEIAGMSGKEISRTVPKVLELVDLLPQARKFPDQLSGGQKQRVSIARSVALQPKILIADEPTANLDMLTTEEIINLLKKINDFGTTILVTTHNENIVNSLQKRVITMKDGKIISDQRMNGVYKLEETGSEAPRQRIIQSPGHALKNASVYLSKQLANNRGDETGSPGPDLNTAKTPLKNEEDQEEAKVSQAPKLASASTTKSMKASKVKPETLSKNGAKERKTESPRVI